MRPGEPICTRCKSCIQHCYRITNKHHTAMPAEFECAACAKCDCVDGRRIIMRGGVSATEICSCALGEARKQAVDAPPPPETADPHITEEAAAQAAQIMQSSMQFMPGGEIELTGVASELETLVGGTDPKDALKNLWTLTRFMTRNYRQWPGVREMRIVYCNIVGPPLSGDDLIGAVSERFPDGFPVIPGKSAGLCLHRLRFRSRLIPRLVRRWCRPLCR